MKQAFINGVEQTAANSTAFGGGKAGLCSTSLQRARTSRNHATRRCLQGGLHRPIARVAGSRSARIDVYVCQQLRVALQTPHIRADENKHVRICSNLIATAEAVYANDGRRP